MAKSRIVRSRARLAATQALYQMELSGEGAEDVVAEFVSHRIGFEQDAKQGEALAEADEALFTDLVEGVVARQVEVDKSLAGALSANWALDRLDSTLRAVLRVATYELIARKDVPAKVVLDEYLRIAAAFFSGGDEIGFANGVLNTLARRMRPAEFGAPAA